VKDYSLLGVRASFTTDNWEVFAEARNLRDDPYVATIIVKDVATPDSAMLFPGAPLSYYVGTRYQF
jgi:hypothetical protein